MAKDPSVLFYTQDFLIGSSLLTPLQKGHYITLLCYQQQSETGSLTLEVIQSLMKADFKNQWPAIKKKFQEDGNGFFNVRMRSEIEKRKKFSNRQKDNAAKRWDKPESSHGISDGNAMAYPMGVPLENANENENRKGVEGENKFDQNMIFDVEQELLKNQIAFEKICMSAGKRADFAKISLRKYHLWMQQNEKYPASRRGSFAGFEKWLMNEKNYSPEPEKTETNGKTRAIEEQSKRLLDSIG